MVHFVGYVGGAGHSFKAFLCPGPPRFPITYSSSVALSRKSRGSCFHRLKRQVVGATSILCGLELNATLQTMRYSTYVYMYVSMCVYTYIYIYILNYT